MLNGKLIKCYPKHGLQAALEKRLLPIAVFVNAILIQCTDKQASSIQERAKWLEKGLGQEQWTIEEWSKRGFNTSYILEYETRVGKAYWRPISPKKTATNRKKILNYPRDSGLFPRQPHN